MCPSGSLPDNNEKKILDLSRHDARLLNERGAREFQRRREIFKRALKTCRRFIASLFSRLVAVKLKPRWLHRVDYRAGCSLVSGVPVGMLLSPTGSLAREPLGKYPTLARERQVFSGKRGLNYTTATAASREWGNASRTPAERNRGDI